MIALFSIYIFLSAVWISSSMVRFLFFAWEAKPQAMLSSYLNSLFSATIFFEIIQNKIYFSAVNINQCNKFIPSVTVDFSVFAE